MNKNSNNYNNKNNNNNYNLFSSSFFNSYLIPSSPIKNTQLINISIKTENLQTQKISRNNFNFLYVIGKGGFGRVWKVQSKKTKITFALKEMSKLKILDKKSEKSIKSEKTFLQKLFSPFIVNMHYAFQDNNNLYLVIDYLNGGDLRYHISRYHKFSEEQTRFFISCIILALKYIHSQNIIHRDIKPENLVLDQKGYLRLTDFGIAKENLTDNSSETSGTPGYMSPEVMCAKNHSFTADFFAIGVIGFEFMLGKRPYNGRNRKEIKEKMLGKEVKINKDGIENGWSLESVDFINCLLKRKPENRLGKNGVFELMNHEWLKYYPWDDLEKGKLLAPFIPEKKDNFDKRYCESIDKITEETKLRYEKIYKSEKFLNAFSGFYYDENFKTNENNNNYNNINNKNDKIEKIDINNNNYNYKKKNIKNNSIKKYKNGLERNINSLKSMHKYNKSATNLFRENLNSNNINEFIEKEVLSNNNIRTKNLKQSRSNNSLKNNNNTSKSHCNINNNINKNNKINNFNKNINNNNKFKINININKENNINDIFIKRIKHTIKEKTNNNSYLFNNNFCNKKINSSNNIINISKIKINKPLSNSNSTKEIFYQKINKNNKIDKYLKIFEHKKYTNYNYVNNNGNKILIKHKSLKNFKKKEDNKNTNSNSNQNNNNSNLLFNNNNSNFNFNSNANNNSNNNNNNQIISQNIINNYYSNNIFNQFYFQNNLNSNQKNSNKNILNNNINNINRASSALSNKRHNKSKLFTARKNYKINKINNNSNIINNSNKKNMLRVNSSNKISIPSTERIFNKIKSISLSNARLNFK